MNIPEDARHTYSTGECHVLAIAFCRLYDWKPAVIFDISTWFDEGNEIRPIAHVYSFDPSTNLFYDIFGVREANEIKPEMIDRFCVDQYRLEVLENEDELMHYVGFDETSGIEYSLWDVTDKDITEAMSCIDEHMGDLLNPSSRHKI